MLGPQSIEDPLDRMALFGRGLFVLLEDFLNERQEPIQLGLGPRLTLPIAGRLGVAEDFFQGLPVQVVFLTDRPLAFLLGQHQATDFGPEMHVLVHSCFSRFVGLVTDLPLQVLVTNPRIGP